MPTNKFWAITENFWSSLFSRCHETHEIGEPLFSDTFSTLVSLLVVWWNGYFTRTVPKIEINFHLGMHCTTGNITGFCGDVQSLFLLISCGLCTAYLADSQFVQFSFGCSDCLHRSFKFLPFPYRYRYHFSGDLLFSSITKANALVLSATHSPDNGIISQTSETMVELRSMAKIFLAIGSHYLGFTTIYLPFRKRMFPDMIFRRAELCIGRQPYNFCTLWVKA